MSKHIVRAFSAVGLALFAIAMAAPTAGAEVTHPGYEQFAGCPKPKPEATGLTCLRWVFSGGHIHIGKKEIPISNPITLSGGAEELFETAPLLSNSEGGLEAVQEPVPGGLIGSTRLDWLANYLNLKQLMLYAVIELAGQPTQSFDAMQLSVKVHLVNSALGSHCYVGSNANPIVLSLTDGTTNPPPPNKPITGAQPAFGYEPEREILSRSDGTYVDNSFAVPGVSGCALSLLHGAISLNVNSLINAKFGLPARAGTNEAVLDFDQEIVDSFFVYQG